MEEKEIIYQLKELRKIKPDKKWVLLTKERILGQEKTPFFSFFLKPAYAGFLLIFIFFGLFGFSQNSLPGDPLYTIKKIVEKIEGVFVEEDKKSNYQIELAKKRLEELKILAETNQVKKLPSAFKEVRESTVEATKNLAKTKKIDQKIIANLLEFENTKKDIEEKVLATQIGIDEKENPAKIVIEFLISDLEKRSLTEEQKNLFEKAKEDFEKGDYAQALIKLQQLSNLSRTSEEKETEEKELESTVSETIKDENELSETTP